jgi:hypothetical protein
MIALFGLPAPASLKAHQNTFFAHFNVANNFIARQSVSEKLFLDGETIRLEAGLSHAISKCWSGQINVPFISHGGGGLDSFLDSWHQAFNLPESGRPEAPSNQLKYAYKINDDIIINQVNSSSGLGDIKLSVIHKPFCAGAKQFQFRVGLKLPTGKSDELLGSDTHDLFLDTSVQSDVTEKGLSYYATGGLLLMSKGSVFPNQKSAVFYATGNIAWQLNPSVELSAQITTHSPFFESNLSVLGQWSIQMAFGGVIALTKAVNLELSMTEDPIYGASPDVVFQAGLVAKF